LKGHGFSRAATEPVKSWALAPEETARNAPDSVMKQPLGIWLDAHVSREMHETVVFVLAVLAIGFAIFQFTDSAERKKASADIKYAVQSLKGASTEIKAAVSSVAEHQLTLYVGAFPSNLDEIDKLLERSTTVVKIMADVI